jgi:hypothetical protein
LSYQAALKSAIVCDMARVFPDWKSVSPDVNMSPPACGVECFLDEPDEREVAPCNPAKLVPGKFTIGHARSDITYLSHPLMSYIPVDIPFDCLFLSGRAIERLKRVDFCEHLGRLVTGHSAHLHGTTR